MSQRETPCIYMSWKCFGRNLFENHLGVALIQPGDSVIVANERFCVYRIIRVEPRILRPLHFWIECKGFYYVRV